MKNIEAAKTITSLLVRRPPPKPGESFRGYALRVDYENTVGLFRPSLRNVKKACTSLRELESGTGRKLKLFCGGVFLREEKDANVTCTDVVIPELPPQWVSANEKRICPHCLEEHGFMRGIWEIQVIDSCLEHGCRLICRCNRCKGELDWTGGSLMTCRCGASLSAIETIPVGPMRGSLDRLLADRLNEIRIDEFASTTQHPSLPLSEQSFAASAVIAFHIAPQVGYAINSKDAAERKEQQADLALRLIGLGRPGIEAALFSALGNQLQQLRPRERALLLYQDEHSRLWAFLEKFNLKWPIANFNFVRHVVLPAWDEAHRKWRVSADKPLIGPVDSCVPEITQRRVARQNRLEKWGIWGDERTIGLIVKLGKVIRRHESRNEFS